MTRIDHAKNSRCAIGWAESYADDDNLVPRAVVQAGIAQAEAVLALVEQQKIANKIALDVPDRMSPIWHKVPTSPEWQLRPDIAAALGVES